MNKTIPLYVINLSKDVDRWASVSGEVSDHPFQTKRVDAVNAIDLPRSEFVSPGVNAAWLSHMKAMQEFLDSKEEIAIIAEDDFHLVNPLKFFTKFNSLRWSEWDLVQLGFLKPGLDTRLKIRFANLENLLFRVLGKVSELKVIRNMRFSSRMRVRQSLLTPNGFVIDDCQPGAHFYMVRRSFCEAILTLNHPQFLSIDDFYTALSRMRTFKMIRVKHSLVSQKPFAAWAGPRFTREL